MTSAAKIAANRRNAQRSTGPRSAAGKARTRYNALHYRFSVPARYDPKTDAEIQGLAVHLSADSLEPCEQDLAMRAAEAQFDLFRMQRAKVDLINGIAKHLKYTDASLGEGDHLALAFMRKSKMLAAFDRYERRAASRRNRLLRKLRMLQELHRRRAAVERVGPPRPREHLREMPFVEDVVRLEIHRVVKAAIETEVKMTSPSGPPAFCVHLKWGSKRQCSSIYVAGLNADHGFLVLVNQQGDRANVRALAYSERGRRRPMARAVPRIRQDGERPVFAHAAKTFSFAARASIAVPHNDFFCLLPSLGAL